MQVGAAMYKSLKPWVNIPYSIRHFIKRSGTGKAIYSDPVDGLCYPEAKMQIIKDSNGAETVSSHVLYIDGNTSIDVQDCIVFEGKEWTIKNINSFYRDGHTDCKVVYL